MKTNKTLSTIDVACFTAIASIIQETAKCFLITPEVYPAVNEITKQMQRKQAILSEAFRPDYLTAKLSKSIIKPRRTQKTEVIEVGLIDGIETAQEVANEDKLNADQ